MQSEAASADVGATASYSDDLAKILMKVTAVNNNEYETVSH